MVRSASCPFADEVKRLSDEAASSAIQNLRELHPSLPPSPWDSPPPPLIHRLKGCMSAFIISSSTDEPRVIALGIGTKFLSRALLIEDMKQGKRIHDCHAEVLARRGLKRWLMRQIALAREGETSSLTQEDQNGKDIGTRTGYKLREGVKLHFYCSSCPCGNASLRRWAQAGKEASSEAEHVAIGLQAIKEGQIQLLVKRNYPPSATRSEQIKSSCDRKGTVPPGCSIIEESWPIETPLILTCSDKIALWNAIGYQGAFLSYFFTHRVAVSSITVDRKFAREHLRRALCCRLQNWRHPVTGEAVSHPSILCPTESASNNHHIHLTTDDGDDKEEDMPGFGDLCVVWWEGSSPEAINGRTGLDYFDQEKRTSVSKRSMLEGYLNLKGLSPDLSMDYHTVKREASSSYANAKQGLFVCPTSFAPAVGTRGHPASSKRRISSGYHQKQYEKIE